MANTKSAAWLEAERAAGASVVDTLQLLDASSNVIATGACSLTVVTGTPQRSETGEVTITGTAAAGTGTVAVTARLLDASAPTHYTDIDVMQTGDGVGEVVLDNPNIADGQSVTITNVYVETGALA